MRKPETLEWLFLDLNSYFASVEQQDNPALRGRPVAVVPMDTDSTCAIAASYEAKAYGIKTGTPIYEAKKMCPQLRCVLARHEAYVRYHHCVEEEVIRHTPINKIWSIDELSSRLPPGRRTPEAATAVAQRIKEGLRKNVGAYIRCSIGLAPNSFLAKVATDMQKPDGLVVLDPAALPGPLLKLDLIDLPGINVSMEARLHKAGIKTVEQLWNLDPRHARRIWGGVAGERFWYNLRGYDIPDIKTNPSMLGHSRILDPELRRPAAAWLVARRLTVKAATRLRRKEFFATAFHVSVRVIDGPRWAMEARFEPVHDNFTFLRALEEIWAQMLADTRPQRISKVSVTLHGLRRPEEITGDLFDTGGPQRRRDERLSGAMDRLNEKYGAETIRLGVSPRTRAGYVGTKIAFSRVPELAEFSE